MLKDMAVITLPAADVMQAQLETVIKDRHLTTDLYPRFLQHAGEQKVGPGLVLMLQLAIHDYTKGYPAAMFFMVSDFIPDWIKALTVDHPQVREDALKHWELLQEAKTKKGAE